MKLKTRRVKPPTRLMRIFFLTFFLIGCISFTSCSLFKVYAGRVEYADSQHSFSISVDTLHAERPIKTKLYQPIIIHHLNSNHYAQFTKTYRPLQSK